MALPTLPVIEIPQSQPNEFGVTVSVGHFEYLKVSVPPLVDQPPFGPSIVRVLVDGELGGVSVVEAGDSDPVEIDIDPFALRCCWQIIEYTVTNAFNNEERSVPLRVLNVA